MKLKKIASLMLAGVMAVSMLAGCSTTTVDPEPTPDPDPTPATGYSAKLQSELSAISQDKLTLADDNELNSALEYAVGNIGNNSVSAIFGINGITGGKVHFVVKQDVSAVGEVVKTLRDARDTSINWTDTAASEIESLNPQSRKEAFANYYTKNDVSTLLVYVVDDGVNLNNAMDQIANLINGEIEKLADDFDAGNDTTSVNYHYTGSVATCNKSFESIGVNFIAVELVRHIGK